jgi:L-alanine-DL-glutamate epimerase-like enolase superfamily enzyme
VKVAGDRDDLARVETVRRAAPRALIVVDPNESWTLETLSRVGPEMVRLGVSMVEQPVPADADEGLAELTIDGLTICADEAVHTRADLDARADRYDAINVKIDKAGGLTEALALCRDARARGLAVMVGCMVCTSLSIAPAFVLSGEADVFDLDGSLLLERDRDGGVVLRNGMLHPPTSWRV